MNPDGPGGLELGPMESWLEPKNATSIKKKTETEHRWVSQAATSREAVAERVDQGHPKEQEKVRLGS